MKHMSPPMSSYPAYKPLFKTVVTWLLACWMLAAALLSACGGGVGSGGSGTGLASYAEGVVSGFGSVIVDGTEFADSQAAVQVQTAAGASVNAQVKLGQRVLVTYDSSNAASVIQILPQLAGPASGAPDSSGWIKVAGQWVKLVDSANATASRPATMVSGYTSLSAILAADEVEVHGNWALDSTLNAWVLVATRLEKLSAPGVSVLVSGIVHSLPSSTTVQINAFDGSLLQTNSLPTNLKTGQLVSAWIARTNWGPSPLIATRVAVQGIASLSNAGDNLRVSGLASDYDAATHTVSIQGVRVSLPVGSGADQAALSSGALVRVDGKGGSFSVQASNASAAQVKPGSATPLIELKGVLNGINWNASTVSFSLRDTVVNATNAVIDKSCRQASAASSIYVEVEGRFALPDSALQATSVKCNSSTPGGATMRRSGTLVSVSNTTLSLQLSSGTEQMLVDANTYFEQPSASLIDQPVDVEGVLITGGSMLRAKAVKRAR